MKDNNHSFDANVAKVLKGHVQKAILLKEIFGWCVVNSKKGNNIKHGIAWTYNSAAKLSDKFYYMPSSSIGRWLKALEDDKWLYCGNFNKKGYDRTKWYTIDIKRYKEACNSLITSINQNEQWINQIEQCINQNDESINQIEQPIPSLTISNTSLKRESKKDTPTNEKSLLDQIKKLEAANLELKNKSEAQKEEPKSSVKKVFPSNKPRKAYKAKSNDFPSMSEFDEMPRHEDQITTKYEMFLSSFTYPPSWSKELIEKFLEWCEHKNEILLGKFGGTSTKAIIREINDYLKTFDTETICKSIDLSLTAPYSRFNPKWILDRQEKEKQDEKRKDEQTDSSGKPLRSKYERFGERLHGTKHTTNSTTEDFTEQEF